MPSPSKTMIEARCSSGGHFQISLKKAREYEARGRGRIDDGGGVFRFAQEGHVAESVQASMRATAVKPLMRYDDGLATLQQVRGLPCAGDAVRLFIGKRPQGPVLEDRVVELSAIRSVISVPPAVSNWPAPRVRE